MRRRGYDWILYIIAPVSLVFVALNHWFPLEKNIPLEKNLSAITIPTTAEKPTCSARQLSLDSSFAQNKFLQCLYHSSPGLSLKYPSDAEKHFVDIHKALKYTSSEALGGTHEYAGYAGPWIENDWIDYFYDQPYNFTETGVYKKWENFGEYCLSDLFGPFVPLFIPWVDNYIVRHKTYRSIIKKISSVLRKDVPYVTVSQSDDGTGLEKDFPNILFLSAGGYGHVPVPLYKQDEKYHRRRPAAERHYVLSYVGSLDTAPRSMREEMNNALAKRSKKYSSANFPERKLYKYHYGPDWRHLMTNSLFSLAPRGWGRTAFHVLETLQMGLIPVQVYTDMPWIPYENILLNVSDPLVYACSIDKLPNLVEELLRLPLDEIERKEKRIRSLYRSHFLPISVMKQIQGLLTGGSTDLVCRSLPATARGQ